MNVLVVQVVDVNRTLDMAPLRSFVAVADNGGFMRAAVVLHLSQAAISQHVRRLESAVGHPLVERSGRGSKFTKDGEQLLGYARRILALHDDALHSFGMETLETVVIGSTEHAAAQLLPALSVDLEQLLADYEVRLRIDRGTHLREGLAAGRVDLALLLGPLADPRAVRVGELELTWYSAPGWRPPKDRPLPLVAFDDPCVLRTRALETLAAYGISSTVAAEAPQLAGVQAAVAACAGVALMATLGQIPAGLVPRDDLPRAVPLELSVCSRQGLAEQLVHCVAAAVRQLITEPIGQLDAADRPLAS
jgi:DNA-binding transcriptional LysR family regulator